MSDRILLRGLSVRCVVGVRPDERAAPREILLDLTLETDLRQAGATDDLADTVDYDALATAVRRRVEASSPALLETVAAAAADACLADPRVTAAEVVVHKPGAVAGAADVAVSVRRSRD